MDMYSEYRRSPNGSDYRLREDYDGPMVDSPPGDLGWRERRTPPRSMPIRYGERERSPSRRDPLPERSPDRREPFLRRSPGRREYLDRSPSDYRGSPNRYSSDDRRRSLSPERRERGYRSSPRDNYDDRRARSPNPLPPGVDDYVRETPVIRIHDIPEDITETEIRTELQMFGASVCSVELEQQPGIEGARGRICFVEFADVRDSSSWMQQQKGYLIIKGAQMPVAYSDRRPQNVPPRDSRRHSNRDRYDRHSGSRDRYERRSSSRDRYERRDHDRDRRGSSRDRGGSRDRDRRSRDRDHDRSRDRSRSRDRGRRDDYDRRREDRHRRHDDRRDRRNDSADYSRGHFQGKFYKKTDTMIVMGLDKDTTVPTVRTAFEYITHFKIVDIRLVKDKFGSSRGFCFVQWESIDECCQVLEYLKTATPRFHIEGKQVTLDYSQPRQTERQPSSASANVAAAAIEAAKWSKLGVNATPQSANPANIAETAMQQVANAQKQVQRVQKPADGAMMSGQAFNPWQQQQQQVANVQRPQRFPSPDVTKYVYDQKSGYYYDASTGLYYSANTKYYYNSFSGVYLYWDQSTHTYLPVTNDMQMVPQAKVAKDKVEKEPEKEKSKSAKKIAKDMERWAKAQNKKKEETKRLMEENTSTVKKESSTGDIGFSLLEKKISEEERRATVKDAFAAEVFKSPAMVNMKNSVGEVMSPLVMANHSSALPGLSSYNEGSDSDEDRDEPLSLEEQLDKLTNWDKMACLLCRRAFASREALKKHQSMSDLHKQNVEALRSKTKEASSSAQEQPKYRDRAAERRSKYGIADPPLKKGRFTAPKPVPYEQPTKHGIGDSNIGNKMMQKMGWKSGSGLGKSQSGITVPIVAEQRTRGAGLGVKGSRLGPSVGESYKDVARQRLLARYKEID